LPKAEADQPAPVTGSWSNCQFITDIREAGPNIIITWSITVTYTGSFNGTWQGTERDVIFANGRATFHASGIFTGSLSGSSPGTATMNYAGTASGPEAATAHWTVEQGSGGLAGLHGQGRLEDIVETPTQGCDDAFVGNYTGQIQFAP
jgi:hypothetical protein